MLDYLILTVVALCFVVLVGIYAKNPKFPFRRFPPEDPQTPTLETLTERLNTAHAITKVLLTTARGIVIVTDQSLGVVHLSQQAATFFEGSIGSNAGTGEGRSMICGYVAVVE